MKWFKEHSRKISFVILSLLIALTVVTSGFNITVSPNGEGLKLLTIGKNEVTLTIGTASATGATDYTCNGLNDSATFQTAMNALPATGGKLEVLGGTYIFTATVTRAIPNVTIEGVGQGTSFTFNGVNPIFTAGGNGWVMREFDTDAGDVSFGATTGWVREDVNGSNYNTSGVFTSRVTAGTAPFSVTSNTTVSNLSAGLVDGYQSARTVAYLVATSDASASVKAQADYVLAGAADDLVIQPLLDVLPVSGDILVVGSTINTSTTISIHNNSSSLILAQGTTLDYTGSGSAVSIQGDFVNFEFDNIKSSGATADYGIKDLGARWATVKGNNIGTSAVASTNRFKVAAVWFDAANSVIAGAGGSVWDIKFINHGQYGVKLDSNGGITYEGNQFNIGVIMRSTVSQVLIGSSSANETVRNNSFSLDLDSQSISPILLDVNNDDNNIIMRSWAASTGTYDVIFESGAANNHLSGGSSINILRVSDLARENTVLIGTQGLINEIKNASFEVTDNTTNPQGWTLSGAGATYARSIAQVKDGVYSLSLTRNGADCEVDGNYAVWNDAYRGKRVTAGMWVYATVASRAFFYLEDGIGTVVVSPFHSGNAGWEWITATGSISGTATRLAIHPKISTGNTTAYFDGGIVVFGESLPPSSSPPLPSSRDLMTRGNTFIPSGATQVTVTHGYPTTPDASQIMVTYTSTSTLNPGVLFTGNITATQFTIYIKNDPGASGVNLGWVIVP